MRLFRFSHRSFFPRLPNRQGFARQIHGARTRAYHVVFFVEDGHVAYADLASAVRFVRHCAQGAAGSGTDIVDGAV